MHVLLAYLAGSCYNIAMNGFNISKPNLTYNYSYFKNPHEHPQFFMMHSHNSYEIIFFEKGDANYVIEDRKYRLKPNDFIFIRPLKHHYVEIKEKAEYSRFNISFDSKFISKKLLDSIPGELEVINCPGGSVISENFKRMSYYNMSMEEEDFIKILACLLTEIFYNIKISKDNYVSIPSGLSPILTETLDYINENLFTIKDIKEISNRFFISESYLFKLFQAQLKTTPKKYIQTKRLLYAQKLIRGGKRPTDVFPECGFETYIGFYKNYKKNFGYSPSEEKNNATLIK